MLPQVFFEIFKNVAQVSVLFSWMDIETRLKKLNIRGNSLKSVPPELLAKLLNRFFFPVPRLSNDMTIFPFFYQFLP